MSYLTVIRSHDRKVAINYYYYYYYYYYYPNNSIKSTEGKEYTMTAQVSE